MSKVQQYPEFAVASIVISLSKDAYLARSIK